jgi:integrase
VLFGVEGYNAKEDPRHDRRTVSIEEQKRLIAATEAAGRYAKMTGPHRALMYRLAIETGLRYSEIGCIRRESFDWEAPSVRVEAAYTKNGQEAVLRLTDALAGDLAAYVGTLKRGEVVFPLQEGKGAQTLRHDLKVAGIPYVDDAGRFFDFHALRCQLATNADAAGVSPRVVQRMMRHSSLELTNRYTRPRAVDIDAAVDRLPSLKPASPERERLKATGTEGVATESAPWQNGASRKAFSITSLDQRIKSQFDF